VATGAAGELDDLRAACDTAIAAALTTGPDTVVLLGGGPATGTLPGDAVGSLRPYGLALDVPLRPGADRGGATLPLSLTVGAWLLARSGWDGPREAVQVDLDPMGGPGGRREVADALAGRADRVALLVLADGSSSRNDKAPGSYQPGAEAFDAQVAAVLASGDPQAGLKVKYDTAREVGAQGWSAWRTAFHAAAPGPWRARLEYDAAPYGVGYLVASWT
jgi:hypothetical protein